ncbi:hypothetical protein ACJBPV_12090, partial [Streptococcus suis]
GTFFYTQKSSIISMVDLPTTDIIEPFFQWMTTLLKFQVKLNQANTKGLAHAGPFTMSKKSGSLSTVVGRRKANT